jgi:hypothetical protein
VLDNSIGELPRGGVAAQVLRLHLPLRQNLVHALPDLVAVVAQGGVLQQVCRAQQHRSCTSSRVTTSYTKKTAVPAMYEKFTLLFF